MNFGYSVVFFSMKCFLFMWSQCMMNCWIAKRVWFTLVSRVSIHCVTLVLLFSLFAIVVSSRVCVGGRVWRKNDRCVAILSLFRCMGSVEFMGPSSI